MTIALTPQEYAAEVWKGGITGKTVLNWIKKGKMPPGTRVEITPTGRHLIYIEEVEKTKVQELVEQMKAKAKAA
ncbi:hypothetical protein LJ739_07000 [Aestuariibacter halophilus]|uniref:Excisionase n=1 Tax=Fluctibacter halophilus TaxID=226011 RepID=A0ABS8G635_9ALTE|nr:hypothetical protein [Aestuariibacter halophilus]MCC2615985.1 hypothetical protein [Aestuariibacter halophilus]